MYLPGVGKVERVLQIRVKGLRGHLDVFALHLEVPGRQVRDGDVDMRVVLRLLSV